MAFPSASSYTQIKWLAFFAELTAKLTHHNVLVVMEGAELLKRLLISRVSIAAVLQQGDLLVRLLDSWRGCVTAERHVTPGLGETTSAAPSAAIALNDELSFVLAESISQCVDLMWSLYADGDAYYCLLVLARAGPMLEVLLDVLERAPPQLYGITASLAQQLLALPLGHCEVSMAVSADGVEHFGGLDQTTRAQLQKSVPLRRHVRSLVEAVQEHGALLQHAVDVLAELLAVQQGPRCLAAVCLFNAASKRLRKFELRSGHDAADASPASYSDRGNATTGSPAMDRADDNSELNVTITGAPNAASCSTSPSSKGGKRPSAACALDDLEDGLDASSTATSPSKARGLFAPPSAASVPRSNVASPSPSSPATGASTAAKSCQPSPQDVSAVVDAEPVRQTCNVPPALAEEALQHLASSRSHEAFFDALDWVWCLTVADPAVVGAALTPDIFANGICRYLRAAPRTRRDRILFTLLLLWIGHLHSVSVLRPDTHRSLLETAATALLPMLHAELRKEGGQAATAAPADASAASLNVSAITSLHNTNTRNNVSTSMASAMALAASTGYSGGSYVDVSALSAGATAGAGLFPTAYTTALPFSSAPPSPIDEGTGTGVSDVAASFANPTLLPYATARKAQEAALLLRPSIQLILMAFLLNVHTGIDAERRSAWVCQGRVLDVAALAIRRAEGVRSALMDTPTTIDGALSDEVYLDYALRSVRTDVTTVAVLGCRLIAAVVGGELRWGTGGHDGADNSMERDTRSASSSAAALHAELALFAPAVMPLLVHLAVSNPDVTAAQEGGAASPVHYVPSNLRCSRYTSLGEASLVALDAVMQYYAQSGQLRTRGDEGGALQPATRVAVEDLVRVLPALTRVSQRSVHPPVRALPYRCLLYISQRIEDVLVVLRDMPSLANAAVACVVDYSSTTSSQWEAAAAAEWLTVLVDLLTEAEAAMSKEQQQQQQQQHPPSPPPPQVDTTFAGNVGDNAEASQEQPQQRRRPYFLPASVQLNEYFHFDDSPLSQKLLSSVAMARRRNTGSAYAMAALLQLAIHLQGYVENVQRRRSEAAKEHLLSATLPQESLTQPLAPAGLSSLPQWILLLQSVTADNARLHRICTAFQRSRLRHSEEQESAAVPGASSDQIPASGTRQRTNAVIVLKDAWSRALTASEQIALQYAFTGSVFRALDALLRADATRSTLYGRQLSNTLVCEAVAAAMSLPSPPEVTALLAMRFHAFTSAREDGEIRFTQRAASASPALLFGYQAAVQWACRVGTCWLRGLYACNDSAARSVPSQAEAKSTACGGLPSPCALPLVEALCSGAETVMQDAADTLTQRTRCEAAMLLSAVVQVCPVERLSVVEACGAAVFAASTTLRRAPCVSALQCHLLRRVSTAARYAAAAEHSWLKDNLAALQATVERMRECSPAAAPNGDGGRNSSPRRGRKVHSPGLVKSPQRYDSASAARELQAFQVLTAVLTSLVACSSPSVHEATLAAPAAASLLSSAQRQSLCAVLCDALCLPVLQHGVLTAVRAMAETAEGRQCLLTDISTAGDPLGRNLFGRVLALTFRMPCRWAGHGAESRSVSGVPSPCSTPQLRQTRQRSSSASPRPLSPGTMSARSPQVHLHSSPNTQDERHSGADPIVMVGCDVCAALLGHESATARASTNPECDEGSGEVVSASTSASFLSAFIKHRGVEYLAKTVVECDQQCRRQGRVLAVSAHLLRCLAALSLHTTVAKDIVYNTDLFSIVVELAGTAFAPHCTTATLALLVLRNVCFDESLKSVLCQDVRVLLTLKAAGLQLTCVSQLVEQSPVLSPSEQTVSSAVQGKRTNDEKTTAVTRGGQQQYQQQQQQRRRAPVEVSLRDDVVDPENASAVAWAKQMCVYARTQRSEDIRAAAAKEGKQATRVAQQNAKQLPARALSPSPSSSSKPRVFGDITNAASMPSTDISARSGDLTKSEKLPWNALATDAEAKKRSYLAATGVASLWYNNQRGKAAITDTLLAAPSWSMGDVQKLARQQV